MFASSLPGVQTEHLEKRNSRFQIGLQLKKTGVPIFLVASESALLPDLKFINGQRSFKLLQDLSEEEKKVLLPFFDEGGSTCWLAITPKKNGESLYQALLGSAKSYDSRTGAYLLEGKGIRADLVSVPQSMFLKPNESISFWNHLLSIIEKEDNLFALIDAPLNHHPSEIIDWAKKIQSPDAGIFYPYIYKNDSIASISPLVSALLQKNDKKLSLADAPINRPLTLNWKPTLSLNSFDVEMLAYNGVSSLYNFTTQDTRLWGGRTCGSEDVASRFIPTRRSMKALKYSVSSICEKYILEPLNENLITRVKSEVENFLISSKELFDPLYKDPYELSVFKSTTHEATLNLNLNVKFPLNVEKIIVGINFEDVQ